MSFLASANNPNASMVNYQSATQTYNQGSYPSYSAKPQTKTGFQVQSYAQAGKYSSLNYHKASNTSVQSQAQMKKKPATNHSSNLSLTNPQVLNRSQHSSSKQTLKTAGNNTSIIFQSAQGRHNQSMLVHNTSTYSKSGGLKAQDPCFQFDELLRGLDRQVETQADPLKKFELEGEYAD